MATAAYEKIRQEALDKIQSEKGRLIVASQFSATPVFEEHYYDYISKHPLYLGIYTRWVLSQGPLPSLPTDPELYRLREDILGIHDIAEPKKIILNEPLLVFLIDMAAPFFERLVTLGREYYKAEKTNQEALNALRDATLSAVQLCSYEDVQKQGYPDFITTFLDAVKVLLSKELGTVPLALPSDDTEFAQVIEKEWKRLLPYSDFLYGFEVVPSLTPKAMLRYLKLPFMREAHRHLSKERTYQQINNYIVALATFKPMPDIRIRAYFRQELCALYLPLAESIAKRHARKKGQALTQDELRTLVLDEIPKAAASFDYFYATKKNLTGQKISPFSVMLFPLTDQYAAKLGHIDGHDEFPFTDFLQKRLAARMRQYFMDDIAGSGFSLDKEFEDEEGSGTLLDTIADDADILDRRQNVPDYDAIDENGTKLGWKRNTFASIIRKSIDTLKRWDRDGSLVPRRYSVHSSNKKKPTRYRAYTREDREKAKEVEELKAKKARHQA